MGALDAKNPTLIDVATRTEKDGIAPTIVELLNETNEILDDATFIEANDGTTHKTTIRSGLPSATWRMLNYGVQPSKSTTVQIKDACGMLEAYAEVDKSLADLNGNTAAFRLSEDRAFLEAMNQEFVNTLIYGNTDVYPEKFMGLAPRYSTKSGAENGDNIILGGGSGADNTSIWLCVWGPNTLHALYPKGSKAGLQHKDLGEVTLEDVNKGKFQGYRTHYKWDAGLTLRDWRYVVRIANVDVSDLTKTGSTGADLLDLMVQALEIVPNLGMGRPVFYCNRTIKSFLRRQMLNKSNVHLSLDEVAGKKVMSFDGIPVKKCDAILNTEAAIS
jgi:hypothetical protein